MFKKEIRLSGSGGQGIILMSVIFADAAIQSGINAVQSQSYGPEARGGASKAEVIISDDIINFPKVVKPEIFLALTQKAFDKYIDDVKKCGIVIIDNSINCSEHNDLKLYSLPIISETINEFNNTMTLNIVALGVLNEVAKLIPENFVKEAIIKKVPEGTQDINIKSYDIGKNMVKPEG